MNERHIGPSFIVAILSGLGFAITYALGGNAQLEGLFLFGALGGIGTGMILWAKHLFPQDEITQQRHQIESTPDDQEAFASMVETTAIDVTRRKFLSRLGFGAIGTFGVAALFPLKSLGPNSSSALFHTEWEDDIRLMDDYGNPVRATQLVEGAILTVWPEGKPKEEDSATLLIRVPNDGFKPRPGREDWAPEGNVAYSKICTHVGCPVGLYRERTKQLLCPCHQSTFDVMDGGRPAFGPASRSLPQLPLKIDAEGYLVAQSDYREPVGGGFWGRDADNPVGKDEEAKA